MRDAAGLKQHRQVPVAPASVQGRDHLAAGAGGERLEDLRPDRRAEEADRAVAEEDVGARQVAARPAPAAGALAADVGAAVVDAPADVEGPLEEAAVDPGGAAVAGDVPGRLPVLHPGVFLQTLQVSLGEAD